MYVWPRLGTTVELESGYIITAAGADAELTNEIVRLLDTSRLLDRDPTGVNPNPSPIPPSDIGGVYSFASAAEMAAAVSTADGVIATLRGYYAEADGGGGTFYWDLGSTTPADGGLVFGAGSGRWKRLRVSKELNVRWFGAVGDNDADDTEALQSTIDAATPQVSTILFPYGHYRITDDLIVGLATPDGWGLTFQGEAAGVNNDIKPAIIWDGPVEKKSTSMLQVRGFDHWFRNMTFDGRSPSQTIDNCKACAVGIGGEGAYSLGASHIGFERCHFIGVEVGAAMSLDASMPGGLDFCYFEDCLFYCYRDGVWMRYGQSLGTVFDRCVFSGFPPPWQVAERNPGGTGLLPYGVGVRVFGVSGGATSTLWMNRPNFNYIAVGVLCEGTPVSLTIRDVDTENMKRLLWCKSNFLVHTTQTIQGGRYDLSALDLDRLGLTYNNEDDIPGAEQDYISLTSGNLVLEGNSFVSGTASGKFKCTVGVATNIHSVGNFYPNPRPFFRSGGAASDSDPGGVRQVVGRTFSENDLSNLVSVSPPDPVTGWPYENCPILKGCENGGGYVTISDTDTFADVVFDKDEVLYKPFTDAQSVFYVVDLSLTQVESGATVGTPYVTSPIKTGFRINLSAAPGAGKSVRVAYQLRRSEAPLATLT